MPLSFYNQKLGKIFLHQLESKDNLRNVLQDEDVVKRSSISGKKGKIATEERVDYLYECMRLDQKDFGIGFYELYSDQEEFIGIAGFFANRDKERNIYPEICYYILPQFYGKRVASDVIDVLVEDIFSKENLDKIYADAFPENEFSTKILKKRNFLIRDEQFSEGHRNYGQIRYSLTKENWQNYQREKFINSQKAIEERKYFQQKSGGGEALQKISEIILHENKNLIPHTFDMPSDMERVRKLWYGYFSKGINLANGGVENSFISVKDVVINNRNLSDFNMYRSDRVDSTLITEEAIKDFLLEEKLLSKGTNLEKISTVFSFGSHEGFTRLARCIYNSKNTEIIYPLGGYGFLACSAATMKPQAYRIHLVDIDRDNGEKILVSDLKRLIRRNPQAKTLYLESKTTCGAVYQREELEGIIEICKENGIFFVLDMAHLNMEFDEKYRFSSITEICQAENYSKFAVLYTGSKTYGLERARVGFVVTGDRKLSEKMARDLYRVNGSAGDLSFEVAKELMLRPLKERENFIANNIEKHKLNMNIMVAYIEGVNSQNLDPEFRERVLLEIPVRYHDGIKGLKVVYKPESGIQMKVDILSLQEKYLANIRMFNSEIFYYALHKFTNVVALHSYQVMDYYGLGMRLSFSIKDDVHNGMQKMHDFINLLTDDPTHNEFMPDVLAEDLIFPNKEKIEQNIYDSYLSVDKNNLMDAYIKNVLLATPSYLKLSEDQLENAVESAATVIQRNWKKFSPRKISSEKLSDTNINSQVGLKELSEFIQREGKNLIPHIYNLTKDIERSDSLWRYNTRSGIMLSSGGVERSLFLERSLDRKFNGYRNDIPMSVNVSSDEMKFFCKDEGLISERTDMEELSAAFCFGSHEGFTRLARCIYSDDNKEMIYSVGGYGLLARAVSTMKPTPYRVHLAKIDRDNGEKVLIKDLENIVANNSKAKTLYLEAKTMCGSIYSEQEVEEIIKFCKKNDIFFVFDTAHANMEFDQKNRFPDIIAICQKYDHKKFAMIFTGSKTYGLERARVGFVVFGGGEYGKNLVKAMIKDGSRTYGSYSDISFEVAKNLISIPVEERKKFLDENREKHRFNLNLMVGYIEGVNSLNIDNDFRSCVKEEIPEKYQNGLEGIRLVYKPDGGIQLKVNMSDLQNKYLVNIRMFNSEIFSYGLQKTNNVSTLHSYQIMDPEGFGMRLSFSSRSDVHKGMRGIYDFVNSLTDVPTYNEFMPDILAENLIFPDQQEIEKNISNSRDEVKNLNQELLLESYKKNIVEKLQPTSYIKLSEQQLSEAIDLAARKIQNKWQKRQHNNKEKLDDLSR